MSFGSLRVFVGPPPPAANVHPGLPIDPKEATKEASIVVNPGDGHVGVEQASSLYQDGQDECSHSPRGALVSPRKPPPQGIAFGSPWDRLRRPYSSLDEYSGLGDDISPTPQSAKTHLFCQGNHFLPKYKSCSL